MNNQKLEVVTLGGGCLWCIEAVLQSVNGIEKIVSGHMGGNAPGKPTYREVCSGLTGHAEVVQVTFNPETISFEDLLVVFMTSHDASSFNRQGGDIGTQYRSVIFYHDKSQKEIAELVAKEVAPYFENPVVTQISSLAPFYAAEAYHQNYFNNNSSQGYCSAVIAPKLAELRQIHADKMKTVHNG